tara:strand:- start:1359 stop:1520 length:162 start_codon:yes stop_codon:yes gene_type:complete
VLRIAAASFFVLKFKFIFFANYGILKTLDEVLKHLQHKKDIADSLTFCDPARF